MGMSFDRVTDGILSNKSYFPDGSFVGDIVGPALTFVSVGSILDQYKTEKENQRLLTDKSEYAIKKKDAYILDLSQDL